MGWFASIVMIAVLLAFNLFAADTMIKMRNDVAVVRRMVADMMKSDQASRVYDADVVAGKAKAEGEAGGDAAGPWRRVFKEV